MAMQAVWELSPGKPLSRNICDDSGRIVFPDGHVPTENDVKKIRNNVGKYDQGLKPTPGMMLLCDIHGEDGKVQFKSGTILTAKIIKAIEENTVNMVMVSTHRDEKMSSKTYGVVDDEKTREMKQYLKVIMDSGLTNYSARFLDEGKFMDSTENIRAQVFKSDGLLSTLDTLFRYNDYTLQHCVGTAITMGTIAYAMEKHGKAKFTEREWESMFVGGLIHDLGKLTVPCSIITSPNRLTPEEFDIIKQHPAHGKVIVDRILRQMSEKITDRLDLDIVRQIVAGHHLRPDGKGYGIDLGGKSLHPAIGIAGVADATNAMSTGRTYQDGKHATAIEEIVRGAKGTQFFPDAADAYLDYVFVRYPLGSLAILNDGAVVSMNGLDRANGTYRAQVLAALTQKGARELKTMPRGMYPFRTVTEDQIVLGINRMEQVAPELSRYLDKTDGLNPQTLNFVKTVKEENGVSITGSPHVATYAEQAIDKNMLSKSLDKVIAEELDKMVYSLGGYEQRQETEKQHRDEKLHDEQMKKEKEEEFVMERTR